MVELAFRKPTDLGYPHETWTLDLLGHHVREKAEEAGYPSLFRAGKSLVHTILFENEVKLHRIRYYLEKRDPDFDQKKALVLSVYQEGVLRQKHPEGGEGPPVVTVSLDEKPGVQALGLTGLRTVRQCPARSHPGVATINMCGWAPCPSWWGWI